LVLVEQQAQVIQPWAALAVTLFLETSLLPVAAVALAKALLLVVLVDQGAVVLGLVLLAVQVILQAYSHLRGIMAAQEVQTR
jgi:hypothetical protein